MGIFFDVFEPNDRLASAFSCRKAPLFGASVPLRRFFAARIIAFCACFEISVCAFGNIGYNSISRPSGGMADAAVSKTVVERRASSTLASGTILNLKSRLLRKSAFSF